jgi:hypothetical protein
MGTPTSNDRLCAQILAHTGYRTSDWTSLIGKSFVFSAEDGYLGGGCIAFIEYDHARGYFRIFGATDVHVEWRVLDNGSFSCMFYGPHRFAGRPGTFAYAP